MEHSEDIGGSKVTERRDILGEGGHKCPQGLVALGYPLAVSSLALGICTGPYLQRRQLLTFTVPLGPEAWPHFHSAAWQSQRVRLAPLPTTHMTQWTSFVVPALFN